MIQTLFITLFVAFASAQTMPTFKEWSAKGYVENMGTFAGEVSLSSWFYSPNSFPNDPSLSIYSSNFSAYSPGSAYSATSFGNSTLFLNTLYQFPDPVDNSECNMVVEPQGDLIAEPAVRERFNFNGNSENSWLVNATETYDPNTGHTTYSDMCSMMSPCFGLLAQSSPDTYLDVFQDSTYTWVLNVSQSGQPKSVAVFHDGVAQSVLYFTRFSPNPSTFYEGPASIDEQPHPGCVTAHLDGLCYNNTPPFTEHRVVTRTHDWSIWGWLMEDVNVADVSGEATWVTCSFSQYFTQTKLKIANNWGEYQYCNGGSCNAMTINDATQWGHKEAFGASERVDQCYLNHTAGEWFSVPLNGRCPPQYSIGSMRSCSWQFDYTILKTINGSCLMQIATQMGCATHNDSIAVLNQGFQQCPDVGHLLIADYVKTLSSAEERREFATPLQFDASDEDSLRAGNVWYRTPIAGAFYQPRSSHIPEVNRVLKSLI